MGGRRGRKRQLEVESRYWQLLLSGVGTVQARRLVGITRKTGYRWRAENGGVPPARLAEAARSSRYLSLLERQRIATLRGQGLGVREIGRRLDRSPSTVSRELARNLRPHENDRRRRLTPPGGTDWPSLTSRGTAPRRRSTGGDVHGPRSHHRLSRRRPRARLITTLRVWVEHRCSTQVVTPGLRPASPAPCGDAWSRPAGLPALIPTILVNASSTPRHQTSC
jgi:DNA-binding CsgD family transcriptional regulator